MPAKTDNRYEFYSAQYARFGGKLAADVRLEAYGDDFGQQGWRSIKEQAKIVELVRKLEHPRVLDVACGSGGPALAIAAQTGCRLTGVDIEATAIATANGLKTTMGIADTVDFQTADCSRPLPFGTQQFELILCIDAVNHFKDRDKVFADWFRLLKPGGYLLMTDAAVLTGAISRHELDVRASQGEFVCVPQGYNERALAEAGFILQEAVNTTGDVSHIAGRLHLAREKRASALKGEEGETWFANRQAFLSMAAGLAASNKLSRFLYSVQKPV
jgi:SAM-dependent methyltransferase